VNTYGHGAPEIPGWTIAAYVGLGAAAGAIASILPARRSARVSITTTLESP
jgi:ABC-type antimicrobial peptide transport system permease subunit